MTGRLALAVAALLSAVSCDAYDLPADNSLQSFRKDPAFFYTNWTNGQLPQLLGEHNDDRLARIDLSLHSPNPFLRRESLADYMYPFRPELEFTGPVWTLFCRQIWWMGYAAVAFYLFALWAGQMTMKAREPFGLKKCLVAWNLFLAVFSILGALRTVPHLVMLLNHFGFQWTLCRVAFASYGNGPPGLWVLVFVFSKYFELIDTAFLVLRKKPVNFLHWYHHASVLLYCYHALVWEMPTGLHFVAMNYSVHAIMYTYYFLAAVRARPPRWGLLVTVLQLVQMALGIAITLSHLNFLQFSPVPRCEGHLPNLLAALAMYASYFALFAQFLVKRYCLRRTGATAKKVA